MKQEEIKLMSVQNTRPREYKVATA